MWWLVLAVLGCSRSGLPAASGALVEHGAPAGTTKLLPQLGHRSRVTHLALSPDGRLAVTADTEPEVIVWSVDDAVVVHRLRLHRDTIRDLALSPDGRTLATASDDGQVGLWHVASGRLLHAIPHPQPLESVAFTTDGDSVLTGDHGSTLRVFDVASGELRESHTHPGWVEVDVIDDQLFATRSISEVRIWRLGDPVAVARLAPKDVIEQATIRGDARRIAVVREGTVTVHDGDGTVRGTLEGHEGRITDLAFGPRGWLVTTGEDGTARVWDVDAMKPVRTYRGHGGAVRGVSVSPTLPVVVTVGSDHRAHVWDPASGEATVLGGIEAGRLLAIVTEATFGADGTLFTGHLDGTAYTWNVEEGFPYSLLRSRTEMATSVAPSPDGRYLAVAHGVRATIWDLKLGRPQHVLVGHASGIQQIRYAADGSAVYTAANDTGAVRWDPTTGEAVSVFVEEHDKGLYDVAVAPDGTSILTAGADGLVVWWDVETQTAKHRLEIHEDTVRTVAFAPDGLRAFSGGDDGTAVLWDLTAAQPSVRSRIEPARRGSRTPEAILTSQFEPDGKHVLVGTVYRRLLRLDAATGAVVAETELDGPVASLSLDTDADVLVAGTYGGWTYRLDPETFDVRERTDRLDSFVLDAHTVSDDLVASAGMDGTVRFFTKDDPRAKATLVVSDEDWAVTEPEGRFDGNSDTSEELAVWVIDGVAYALFQLRDEFFDPGLLAKTLGFTSAPLRDVPSLEAIAPPARATLEGPDAKGRVTITLQDRGGGIGEVFATLNDSDVSDALNSECGSFREPCTVDLSDRPTWTKGLDNVFRISVGNASGSVRSRGLTRVVDAEGRAPSNAPELWVLAVGSSDYVGTRLDLDYPALDATKLALAARLAGRTGFGPDRTHVRLLATSELANVDGPPTREALEDAFAWLEQSSAADTVLVFLAGHGVALTDPAIGVDDYFYLLPSAGSIDDLRRPSLRRLRSWSGDDLATALARVPARKRAVVLDTCAAGKLDQSLTLDRMLSADAIRAHVRARHRTGAWVLAGSAADQVSYEATRFGQGLLTYALLEGMRGPALDDGSQLWVSRWFSHAEDRVPAFARDIGGVQRPVLRRGAGDFPLGEVPADQRPRIQINELRPVVLRSLVIGRGGRPDRLGVGPAVDAALRQRTDAGARIVVWDVDTAPDAAQLTGQVATEGKRIRFEGVVSLGSDEQPLTAEADDVDTLAGDLADQVVDWVTRAR